LNRLKRIFTRLSAVAVNAAVLLVSASFAEAQILATTARQASSGSLKILAYYQGVQDQTLKFSVNDSGSCSTSGSGAVTFPCGQATDVEAKGSGGAAMLKLVWQPWERFEYYAMYGVGDYSLRVPSTTVVNSLTGDSRGQIYGAGFKASIVPDTIVTPAVALDFNLARSVYDFNRVYPGGPTGGSITQRLELMTYQVSVETSHLFAIDNSWKVEPYGGVKWTRVQTDLKDLVDGSHAGGQQDTVTPFVGVRVPVEDHEAFFAEASFIDGYHYGAGLELRFK
jgi:hypothetical protein